MLTIDIDPTLIHLGPLALSWYGLAVALAIAVGAWLTVREAARRSIVTEQLGDLLVWIIFGGILGARLLHVIDRWDFYATNLSAIVAIQNGGLAILGAILGGTGAGLVGAWRLGLPVRAVADAAAPGLALGLAIGRLGCLVTGDALGPATDGTWGVVYLNERAMAPALGVAYQPTFFYEMVLSVVIFSVIWTIRRQLERGQLFAVFLALYASGKFALTFLRTETVWFWGLQEAHIVAVAMLLGALAWSWGGSRAMETRSSVSA